MCAVPLLHRTTIARVTGAVLAAVLVALTPSAPAWAHNQLRTASPARGANIPASPTQVVLEFAEPLDPTFTTIVVTDASTRRIPTTEPAVSGARGTVTLTQPLGNGTYTVAYRVVSTDGHPVQGSYPFTVSAPGAVTPSTAAPSRDAPQSSASPQIAAAADTGDADGGTVATVAVVLILLAAGGGYLLRRRRRGRR